MLSRVGRRAANRPWVVDMLRKAGAKPIAIPITGGEVGGRPDQFLGADAGRQAQAV